MDGASVTAGRVPVSDGKSLVVEGAREALGSMVALAVLGMVGGARETRPSQNSRTSAELARVRVSVPTGTHHDPYRE